MQISEDVILSEMSKDHVITRSVQSNGEFKDSCSCGLSWTHPITRSKVERIDIYLAHLKYFDRPVAETL